MRLILGMLGLSLIIGAVSYTAFMLNIVFGLIILGGSLILVGVMFGE